MAADLNSDDHVDLAAASRDANTVTVLLSDVGGAPVAIAAVDVDASP